MKHDTHSPHQPDPRAIIRKVRAQSREQTLVHKLATITHTSVVALGYAVAFLATTAALGTGLRQLIPNGDAPAESATAAAPAVPALNKMDQYLCDNDRRTTFNNQSRQINMTGETGVGMAVSYGFDQNCQPFRLRFYDQFHAMLGRHDVLMNDSYESSQYRFLFDGLRRDMRENPQLYTMDTREGRMAILQLVNSWVNQRFHYQSDGQTFYRDEYFASPIESMSTTGSGDMTGDCDDYATAKYIILRDLGFDMNTVFVSVVSPTEVNGTTHAVLMVNIEGGHPAQPRYQVLDNDPAAVIVDSMASGYKTYMAFNGSGTYIFPNALHAAGEHDLRHMIPDRIYAKAPPRQQEARVNARLS